MNELIKCSRELVRGSVDSRFDDILVELITNSVLALLLIKPDLTKKKLPEQLRRINIIADQRSVIDMAHEDLGNYMNDEQLKISDACVLSEYAIEDGQLLEKKYLLISLSEDADYTDIISVLIHEFIHLLRSTWSVWINGVLESKEGLCINYFDIKNNSFKRKNCWLEEGIVQYYTNMAIDTLTAYLEGVDIGDNPILDDFKTNIFYKEKNHYKLQTTMVEKLALDEKFLEYLDETFIETEEISKLENYFNEIMGAENAFSSFSYFIDCLYLQHGSDSEENKLNVMYLCGILQDFFTNIEKKRR